MLQGATLCQPWTQGQLGGLCGLYVVINAIQVVIAPFRPRKRALVDHLYAAGIAHLSKRQRLEEALLEGMDIPTQHHLTRVLAAEATKQTGLVVTTCRPDAPGTGFDRNALLTLFDMSLMDGAAIITCIWNSYDHFTTIVGQSETRLYLHDSYGLRWINKAAVGPYVRGSPYAHQVSRRGILLVQCRSGDAQCQSRAKR